jgi:hypothetical protein
MNRRRTMTVVTGYVPKLRLTILLSNECKANIKAFGRSPLFMTKLSTDLTHNRSDLYCFCNTLNRKYFSVIKVFTAKLQIECLNVLHFPLL